MKISELMRELEQLRVEHGDIEITQMDGRPFGFVVLDDALGRPINKKYFGRIAHVRETVVESPHASRRAQD